MPVVKTRDGLRFRATVREPGTGKRPSARSILGLDEPVDYATHAEAKDAEARAKQAIEDRKVGRITVAQLYEEWLAAEHVHIREQTRMTYDSQMRHWVLRNPDVIVADVTNRMARNYARVGGGTRSHLAGLRVLFEFAYDAGYRDDNPFKGVAAKRPGGRKKRKVQNASAEEVARMLAIAKEQTPLTYYGWLFMSCYAGARPGEVDAMRWEHLDRTPRPDGSWLYNIQQEDGNWEPKTGRFGPPKNGDGRTIWLAPRVVEMLEQMPQISPFIFSTARGSHYAPSSRSPYWKVARMGVDQIVVDGKRKHRVLYACGRHHCGWWLRNIMGWSEDAVGMQLGHAEGSQITGRVYTHADYTRLFPGGASERMELQA